MRWDRGQVLWLSFNAIAAVIFAIVASIGRPDWIAGVGVDGGLESGKWAIRLLLISLSMTPLRRILGWQTAIKLRKPAGLWAVAFAILHVRFFLAEVEISWANLTYPPYLAFGLLAFTILTAMALTSYRPAMRVLGRWWKRLHRLVYVAGAAICTHAILATEASKRLLSLEPQAVNELSLYAGAMAVLLGLRLPFVRRLARRAVNRAASNAWMPQMTEIELVESDVPLQPPIEPERPAMIQRTRPGRRRRPQPVRES